MSYIGNTPAGVDKINSYIGKSPVTVASHIDNFSGDGSTTAFTLTQEPPSTDDDFFLVFVDNVYQREGGSYAFTVSGTTITFTSAPSSGTNNIQVYQLGSENEVGVPSDGTITTDKLGTSAVTTAKIADDAVTISQVDDSTVTLGFRNKIIGGNFSTNPWQRGTANGGLTFTNLGNDSYGADRFKVAHSSDAVVDMIKTADAPTIAQAGVYTKHCLHLDVTTADTSIGADQYYQLRQSIEGYNILDLGFGQSGTRYFTLSFWHKHTVTGTYGLSLMNADNSRAYFGEYTQSSADTWEKAEITFTVDTSGTWDDTNGAGLVIRWILAAGSNFNGGTANEWTSSTSNHTTSNQVNALSSTSNNFKIALVQLEAGQTATAFENRSVGQELELCQRYFERTGVLSNTSYDSNGSLTFVAYHAGETSGAQFRVWKRATPTVGLYSTANVANQLSGNTNTATAGYIGETGISYIGRSGNSTPAGYYGHYEANAEL